MNMLSTCHCATHPHAAHHATSPPGLFDPPTAASAWPMLAALTMMGEALREGLAAHREYEELRSWGMPHDTALRASLGLGARPQQRTRATAKPLHFAGRM
jgi:hypothetical protein